MASITAWHCAEHTACLRLRTIRPPPGKRFPGGEAAALRHLGLRDQVHPIDVWATVYLDPEAARVYAAADFAHFGHPTWTAPVEGGGTLVVIDLRPGLIAHGAKVADPTWDDNRSY